MPVCCDITCTIVSYSYSNGVTVVVFTLQATASQEALPRVPGPGQGRFWRGEVLVGA